MKDAFEKYFDSRKVDLGEDSKKWDVFISHAAEDSESFARPLAEALVAKGLKVWFDEFILLLGDSINQSIEYGLANSKYGVVILSNDFLKSNKVWTKKELNGLVSKEAEGAKVILPVLHNITIEEVRRYAPILSDRLAVSSKKGIDNVVSEILRATQVVTK